MGGALRKDDEDEYECGNDAVTKVLRKHLLPPVMLMQGLLPDVPVLTDDVARSPVYASTALSIRDSKKRKHQSNKKESMWQTIG